LRFALAPSVTAAPSAALLVHTGGLTVPWILGWMWARQGFSPAAQQQFFAPAVCLIGLNNTPMYLSRKAGGLVISSPRPSKPGAERQKSSSRVPRSGYAM
jgi:hypothetical protein